MTTGLHWAAGLDPAAVIGIEGSATNGASLARFLLDAGQAVREVPPHLTRRERIRTRRPGKSDPGDALAIARVTLREPNLPPVRRADVARELQLLVETREDLVAEATRTRNRLHANLLVLLPGSSGSLVGPHALSTLAGRLRRCSGVQAELARERLRALRRPSCWARSVTSAASATPTPSQRWSAWHPSRPARARSSACASTAAATDSSTGRYIWRPWCSCATTRRPRPSWLASGPRAGAHGRPSAA